MKFREKTKGKATVRNYMDGISYKQPEKEELVFSLLSSFMEDTYYEKLDDRLKRLEPLVKSIAEKDPEFIARLAYVVRKEFHMRSSFHVLMALFAKYHKGDSLVKDTLVNCVERPDDLFEIIAIGGKPIPNAIKKGTDIALSRFDEYQLAKYRGVGRNFSLVDIFNLIHPKPTEDKKELYEKVVEGSLKNISTWEAQLSSGRDKVKVWSEMINSGKLGYMAMLRNLRNILQYCNDEDIKNVCSVISNKDRVLKSKQLPFRFLSAYRALNDSDGITFEKSSSGAELMTDALERALKHSIGNIPLLYGKTAILSDNSGSMRGDSGGSSLLSRFSSVKSSDIANLFATLYWLRADNTYVGLFGDKLIAPRLNRTKNLFENFKIIDSEAKKCGASTEEGVFKFFEEIISKKQMVDRIVIFSDCQVGRGCKWYDTGSRRADSFNKLFQKYMQINPSCKVYSIDLRGYGNKMVSGGLVLLSGWSEKIFELMEILERKEGIVKYIESKTI